MNTQQLLGWMNDPASAGKDAGAQLDTLTQTFPYFQTAHLLLIKSLHNQNSFLYNNQLKIAAAYATNRKVLYELITKKAEVQPAKSEPEIAKPFIAEKTETVISPEPAKTETEIVQPEFPKKRFVSNPDEWEAGMLRQLQLLHHWKTNPVEELQKQSVIEKTVQPAVTEEEKSPAKTTEPVVAKTEEPTAADEINTLLYVLVEPDGAEDISDSKEITEAVEENQDWEVKLIEENPEPVAEEPAIPEIITEVPVPEDPVDQEMIREAISSSIELEVDDVLPKPEELIPLLHRQPSEPVKTGVEKEEISVPEQKIEAPQEEIEAPAEEKEMSFSGWLQNLKKTAPEPAAEEKTSSPAKAEPAEIPQVNSLIDRFIKEQPRIKAQKNTFYSSVNMAKKSVQESDEFITETLARIYVKQGNISKAIRSYQKLSLKFPEKTAYFAALIEELKRTPK